MHCLEPAVLFAYNGHGMQVPLDATCDLNVLAGHGKQEPLMVFVRPTPHSDASPKVPYANSSRIYRAGNILKPLVTSCVNTKKS